MTPIQTYIQKTDTREVTTKDGRKFPLHEIHDANGQAWVAKRDVWEFAGRLIGQPVQLMTRTEQNGSFTNYYADAVMPMGGQQQQGNAYGAPGAVGQPGYAHPLDNPAGVTRQEAIAMNAGWDPNAAPMPTFTQMPTGAPVVPQAAQPAVPPPWVATEKDLSIYRQTATKVAAWLAVVQGNEQAEFSFWHILPEIMDYYKKGIRPSWVTTREVKESLGGTPLTEEEYANREHAASAVAAASEGPDAPQSEDDIPF